LDEQVEVNSLFSIYIQKDKLPDLLPAAIQQHVSTFKQHCSHIGRNHFIIGNDEIREIIKNHFDTSLLTAYDKISPHAYKADIGRYSVLYAYGGIYADLAMIFVNPVEPLQPHERACFCQGIAKANISNGFIYSRPGDPLLASALDMIIDRISNDYYGPNPVSITGPRLLGDALSRMPHEHYKLYTVRALTRDLPHLNMAVLDASGRIICLRNKLKTGVHELGLTSSDYRVLWQDRKIYNWES
jgi:mannosyltransferase OCH1-like enzyme